ncbi:MAG: PEP-CTERM sorting domain-containing protein [Verrucomicrobiota bacterium JB024]|nr:PEP-CTERM sorting domain-containing protein [Verrucomicrobiota bacterium JB024]
MTLHTHSQQHLARLTAIAVASGILFAGLSAQAQLVDFSSYSPGVLADGTAADNVNPPTSQFTLTDSEGAGVFSYRGSAIANTGVTTTFNAQIVGSGPSGNYLSISSTKAGSGGGNPISMVFSSSGHATTETQVWTMDFSATKLATPSGELYIGLFSSAASSSSYTLDQISGASTSTVGQAIRFSLSSSNVSLYRTGSTNGLEGYNGTEWVSNISQVSGVTWTQGDNYRVILSLDGTTGAMNTTLQTLNESLEVVSTLFSVDSNVADVGSQGTAGGFRFVTGDIGSNTIFGVDESIYSLSLSDTIPEPSTYAAMAGMAVLGLALLRRRLQRRTA